MSDMKLIPKGPETVTLAVSTINKLIRAGDGDAALLYLFILKTRGESDATQAAAEMGKNPGEIRTAMAVLSRLGLVQLDDDNDVPAHDTLDAPLAEPRQYTIDEIKNELEYGSVFHTLVEETQRRIGKIMSPDEMLRLFGIYDGLRLQPEVILQLITHCITESRGRSGGRMPSIRYIEKTAYTWEREGIFTLERAEEYLKDLETRKSIRGEIKRALQIRDREFSETEKRFVDGWIAMGFDAGAVDIAFDRTVIKTGKMAWSYMDSIMKNWHNKNIHTAQEIQEKDKKIDKHSAFLDAVNPEKKFGSANNEDIRRMERLLNKIKED